jgi:hypothetical protein
MKPAKKPVSKFAICFQVQLVPLRHGAGEGGE